VQYTHDKQKAADIVLRFTEKGRKVSLSDLVGPYALEASPMMNDKQEDSPFRFKMIMVVNGDLKMGKGKICAQVGHAVLGAYLRMEDAARFDDVARAILDNWEYLGQAKIVVRVDNEKELLEIERKAQQIKINTYLVEDAGHTQIKEGSKTVLALGPVLGAMLDPLTSHLKLL
jgi:PTH2 family peptidyl-tRNA hydrolase